MKHFTKKCFLAPWYKFWSKSTARETHSRTVSSSDSNLNQASRVSSPGLLHIRAECIVTGRPLRVHLYFFLSNSTATLPPFYCRTGKLLISQTFFPRMREQFLASIHTRISFSWGLESSLQVALNHPLLTGTLKISYRMNHSFDIACNKSCFPITANILALNFVLKLLRYFWLSEPTSAQDSLLKFLQV